MAFDKTARDGLAALDEQAMIYRATVSSGSINVLTDPGTYIIQPGVTDLPGGAASGLLTVYDFAGEAFVVQSFITTSSSQIGVRYERIVRPEVPSYPVWTDTSIVPNSTIDRAKLVSTYSAKGAINSGSLGALVDTGVYVIQSGVSDIPGGLTSGLLEVENSGDFTRQCFYSSSSSAIRVKYERIIRPSVSSYPSWQDLSVPIDGAVSRSKLATAYAYNAAASSGSINALTAQGSYTIQDGVTDLPAGVTTGLMIVDNFTDYIRQTLFTVSSAQLTTQYQRIIRPSQSSYPAWTTIAGAVADASITRSKLAASYSAKGAISSSSVDSLTDTGIYVIQSGVTGLPSGQTSGLLEVTNSGDYVRQTFYVTTSSAVLTKYERICRISVSSFPSWQTGPVPDASLARAKLIDAYAYNGSISSGSFNDYYKEGNYLVSSALADGPTDADVPTSGVLKVSVWSTSYMLQEFTGVTFGKVLTSWKRIIRPSVPSYGPWGRVRQSRWAGRSAVYLTDSTGREGAGYASWPSMVSANLQLANGYNSAVSGCTLGRRQFAGDAYNDYLRELGGTRMIDGMVSGDWTAQQAAGQYLLDNGQGGSQLASVNRMAAVNFSTLSEITIVMGTNDFACNLPIGADSDSDWTTFKGAINYIIGTFMTAYPSCRMLFATPTYRARQSPGDGKDSNNYPNSSGIYLYEYGDALIERCRALGVPVLDMYRESGINQFNAAVMLSDGLHPYTTAGDQRYADKFTAALEGGY
jgi:hypothetical protein